MKNILEFFENVRLAEEQLSYLLSFLGINVSPRTSVYILAVVLTIICAIATVIFLGTETGDGILLGKTYGKLRSGKAVVKFLFLGIAIIFGGLTCLIFLTEGVVHFFSHINAWVHYFGAIILCVVIEVIAFFVGSAIGGVSKAKVDKKYKQEIDKILSDNPVYTDALNYIKNDDQIKMIVFFRDGISFHDRVELPSDNKQRVISHYDKNFPKTGKAHALATQGSVVYSSAKYRIKFSDYGYQNSESAMRDLYNCIFDATSPKFSKFEYTKEWVYNKPGYTYGPTGAVTNGNSIHFTYSHESGEIKSSGQVLVSYILYENPSLQHEEQPPLKEW